MLLAEMYPEIMGALLFLYSVRVVIVVAAADRNVFVKGLLIGDTRFLHKIGKFCISIQCFLFFSGPSDAEDRIQWFPGSSRAQFDGIAWGRRCDKVRLSLWESAPNTEMVPR